MTTERRTLSQLILARVKLKARMVRMLMAGKPVNVQLALLKFLDVQITARKAGV
jgi:hypothetical protein